MSGLVRRLLIFTTVDGLILHAHGNSDHQRSLALEYGTANFQQTGANTPQHGVQGARLEAFGLIGVVDIASTSYLIAITKRKQVAKIFDKPIYLIEDITVLPLSSQHDAEQAIRLATRPGDSDSNYSDDSGSDAEEENSVRDASVELSTTPGNDIRPLQEKNASSTSIAEIVATRNVSFGRFASQWFSRQKAPPSTGANAGTVDNVTTPMPAEKGDTIVEDIENAERAKDVSPATSQVSSTDYVATQNLLPRILKTVKMVFTSQSYFFSYEFDLTKRFQDLDPGDQKLNLQRMNSVVSCLMKS